MTDKYAFDAHNTTYVEWMLEEYARDPSSVPPEWRQYFDGLGVNGDGVPRRPVFRQSLFHPAPLQASARASIYESECRQDRADQLVRAYRVRGHLIARLDPLGLVRQPHTELDPGTYGLSERDLDQPVATLSVGGPEEQTLRELIQRLGNTYCRYIGAQFMHIDDPAVREWLQRRMEETENRIQLSRAEQLRILTWLTDAVIFEQFVRKKYVGAKTFSLEGSESLIPLLGLALDKAVAQGVKEVVMGMAHRGRLNVLANIIGKTPQEIFWEFEDPDPELHRGRGDVKYHLGFSGAWVSRLGGQLHVSLCFNPSHLEYINPVAQGRMRAKQDRQAVASRQQGLVLLVHGDASFAAEGIVPETLNLSQLAAYGTGGTVHVIVNNQLGFTTPPEQARSTTYPSDVARFLQIPILHVNGEHPEAVAQVVDLAMEFRHRFQRDVVVDLFCYRRWGHNEADEPSFTQPLLYQAIDHHKPVREGYLEHLLELKGVTREEADQIAERRYRLLGEGFDRVKRGGYRPAPQAPAGVWEGYRGGPEPTDDDPETGLPLERLQELLLAVTSIPEDFHVHRKLQRGLDQRREMAAGRAPLDWAAAEALAIASLAADGCRVRLSGQDSQRGTFSQRHAVLHDVVDGREHSIFSRLAKSQAPVEIVNSPLSEAGVLGFEYGYSLDYPDALVMWEAQYGDFNNAAQVIIDQFLVSAEDKWQRLSGLVLLLPHGFEGQGPEHSSARLERFLTLTAEYNIQIASPSTAAQYFHLLRRQALRRWRKPLIVLTPKSLLRDKRVASPLEALANGTPSVPATVTGRFQRVIADDRRDPRATSRVLFCSGKIYYELAEERERRQRFDVAIVRIEQFFPLADELLQAALDAYPNGTPLVWVQEEPENMGAARYWRARGGLSWWDRFPLSMVSRPPSASPATGSSGAHQREQAELLHRAFEDSSHDDRA
jgi:2-oxoglutarate dehydrogenase E1 component